MTLTSHSFGINTVIVIICMQFQIDLRSLNMHGCIEHKYNTSCGKKKIKKLNKTKIHKNHETNSTRFTINSIIVM